jgi:hypothetical protein
LLAGLILVKGKRVFDLFFSADILQGVREAKSKVQDKLTEQERVKGIHLQVSSRGLKAKVLNFSFRYLMPGELEENYVA